MGDYLSELVTKNSGTAEIVQPRRAARFEPISIQSALEAQTESSLFHTASFDEEAIDEIMTPERPRHARQARSSEKNEAVSSRKDSDEQTAQTLFISPTKTRSSETKPTSARVSLMSKEIEAPPETTSQSLFLPPSSLTTLSSIIPKQSPSKSDAPPEKSSLAVADTPIQTYLAPPAKAGEPKMPETKSSEAKAFEMQSIEADASIIAKPRVTKMENRVEAVTIHQTKFSLPPEQTSKQISESAEMPDAPVINITIGRVEVRAVTSSAPSKQTPAKPPTLSLDEYLQKRRNGGDR